MTTAKKLKIVGAMLMLVCVVAGAAEGDLVFGVLGLIGLVLFVVGRFAE
jgi:hypothetical protein